MGMARTACLELYIYKVKKALDSHISHACITLIAIFRAPSYPIYRLNIYIYIEIYVLVCYITLYYIRYIYENHD